MSSCPGCALPKGMCTSKPLLAELPQDHASGPPPATPACLEQPPHRRPRLSGPAGGSARPPPRWWRRSPLASGRCPRYGPGSTCSPAHPSLARHLAEGRGADGWRIPIRTASHRGLAGCAPER
uniref:cDNA FLJ43299 fis, clone NESOP2000744 n=1 Tax=Homo sapiens TaxID=9606 RepID=Q6ZUV2_HUMAN|nr:unnamed protein product [Homo sapiens]